MTIDRITVLSRGQARTMQPMAGSAIISINSLTENAAELQPGWDARLTLFFDDADDIRSGLKCFDVDMARQVLDFVREHIPKQRLLYVHCTMGNSRSAGMAIALSETFGLACFKEGMGRLGASWPHYNRLVYRVLMDEYLLQEEGIEPYTT